MIESFHELRKGCQPFRSGRLPVIKIPKILLPNLVVTTNLLKYPAFLTYRGLKDLSQYDKLLQI